MRIKPSVLLSLNGGYVDTLGFLALQGLFSAHVTGNFVTLAASLVLGTSGAVAKLMALPVFCVVVAVAAVSSRALVGRNLNALPVLLGVQTGLLGLACALAVRLGPFPNGDAWPALVTGMTLVGAMAVQNAAHRLHLSTEPPSTLMTGSTTQIMLDVVALGRSAADAQAVRDRLARTLVSVGVFAIGCALAAVVFVWLRMWAFALPPFASLAAWLLSSSADGATPRNPDVAPMNRRQS